MKASRHFFCTKDQFLLFVLHQTQNKHAEFNYKVYSLHFYQTPNYIRKKTLKESFLEFPTLDAIHNSSLSHNHVAHLKGISRDYISLPIPRDENLRAAKCCLTVWAKRESRKEKGYGAGAVDSTSSSGLCMQMKLNYVIWCNYRNHHHVPTDPRKRSVCPCPPGRPNL